VFSAGRKNVPGHECRALFNLKQGAARETISWSLPVCLIAGSGWLWTLLFVSLISMPASAQYRFDAWTADNGLPQNIIRGMHQTPDGYLWIATLDGVARFDGVHFTTFNKNNTPGIISNRIGSMVGGQGGDLWLAAEGGRIIRYHNGTFETYGEDRGLPGGEPTHGIAADESGAVWVLFLNTMARWDEAAGRFVAQKLSLSQVRYKDLRWGHLGFWGTDGKKLEYFARGRLVEVSLPIWLPGSSIWEAAIDQSGTLWLETFKGLHITLKDGHATIQLGDATLDYIDRHGHAWKMRVGRQLDRSFEEVPVGTNAPQRFSQITEDHENSLWIGTEGQGLYRLQRQSVRMMSKEQGLVDRNVYPIYQDRSGALWVSAWNSGLSRVEAGKFTSYTVKNGLPNPLVSALYEDREGRLWIATHGGSLRIFMHGRLQEPEGPALAGDTLIQAIYEDKEGSLWFGTSQGLIKYSHGLTSTFTTHDGLATNDIHVIIGGVAGDIWIGGYGGLTRLHAGVLASVVAGDLSTSESIRSLYEDLDGVLWIGTYDNGLARLKDGKFTRYTVADGLFNNGAFQILEDAHNNLWMSSNRGIYRVSKQDLNEFTANRHKVITSIAYGTIDGMLNAECNGGLSPAGIKTQDGKMWFPTQNGVAIVDPEAVPRNLLAPPVVIESSLLDHVRLANIGTMRIPPGRTNLEIQYTALSFIKSDQIQFRYRMEGLDSGWVDAGSRRIAYYSHLPPGKYSFQVIAGNSDGVWNTVGQRLSIEVLAPFYRTWQFLTLLFLLAVALIWAAANYRVIRLKQAQLAQQVFSQQLIASQEGERKRIAGELHDSLGQRLVVINNLALFFLRAHRRISQDEDQVESILEISTEATLAIEETRSIAYDLRPFQLDRLGLTKSLESLIRSVSKSSQIHFATDLANIDDLFPEELRINFYRIIQEALSNIMKHAHATDVAVHIVRTHTSVTLSVKDNGRGLVHSFGAAQTGNGGFGITGMTERASLLGGRLTMRSLPSGGTVLSVEIPLEGVRHAT
jgi:signal transduction histidine kinase/ligand-binding sensor domain-containing protein